MPGHRLLCGCVAILASFAQPGIAPRASSAGTRDVAAPPRLNILWLVTEDMSPVISAYGDRTIKTPNLDRLAAEGITYTRAFSVAPVCAPSRASIITGMYPGRIGAQDMRTSDKLPTHPPYEAVPPPEVKCFTEYLRAAGYYATNNDKEDYQFKAPVTAWDESSKKAHWKNRPSGAPFFAVFNFFETHESQIWVQANKPLNVDPEKVPLPPYYPDTPTVRLDVARYYDNIRRMDSLVGEKLKELEDAGLLDKTIIFFYADHGAGLPRAKRELYDSGLRVPFIVRFPDRRGAGTKNEDIVTLMDLGPTMMSLAGAKVPGWMNGRPFLGPQKAPARQHFMASRDRMDSKSDLSRAIRDRRFTYIRHYHPQRPMFHDVEYRKSMAMVRELYSLHAAGKLNPIQDFFFQDHKPPEELYDSVSDPHDIHNLANDPRFHNDLLRLRAILDQDLADATDWGLIPQPDMVRMFWPDFKQPITTPPQLGRDHDQMSLNSPTKGASIAYQARDEIGGNHWQLYSRPLPLPTGTRVRAMAVRIGYQPSAAIDGTAP